MADAGKGVSAETAAGSMAGSTMVAAGQESLEMEAAATAINGASASTAADATLTTTAAGTQGEITDDAGESHDVHCEERVEPSPLVELQQRPVGLAISLRSLSVTQAPLISSGGVRECVAALLKLERLDVRSCDGVTAAEMSVLGIERPTLIVDCSLSPMSS